MVRHVRVVDTTSRDRLPEETFSTKLASMGTPTTYKPSFLFVSLIPLLVFAYLGVLLSSLLENTAC